MKSCRVEDEVDLCVDGSFLRGVTAPPVQQQQSIQTDRIDRSTVRQNRVEKSRVHK